MRLQNRSTNNNHEIPQTQTTNQEKSNASAMQPQNNTLANTPAKLYISLERDSRVLNRAYLRIKELNQPIDEPMQIALKDLRNVLAELLACDNIMFATNPIQGVFLSFLDISNNEDIQKLEDTLIQSGVIKNDGIECTVDSIMECAARIKQQVSNNTQTTPSQESPSKMQQTYRDINKEPQTTSNLAAPTQQPTTQETEDKNHQKQLHTMHTALTDITKLMGGLETYQSRPPIEINKLSLKFHSTRANTEQFKQAIDENHTATMQLCYTTCWKSLADFYLAVKAETKKLQASIYTNPIIKFFKKILCTIADKIISLQKAIDSVAKLLGLTAPHENKNSDQNKAALLNTLKQTGFS